MTVMCRWCVSQNAAQVVVSIFVNPTVRPRIGSIANRKTDVAKLKAELDLVWHPAPGGIRKASRHASPEGPATAGRRSLPSALFRWRRDSRDRVPEWPDFALFGEKDFQQMKVRHDGSVDLGVRIIGGTIVANAMARRCRHGVYLSPDQSARPCSAR